MTAMHLRSTSLRQEAAQAEAQVALQHNSRIALFVCSRLGPDEANLHPIAATVGRPLSLNSTARHVQGHYGSEGRLGCTSARPASG